MGFDECFREHYPRLVALGVSMSGRVEIARELAQETMIRAHSRWDEVAGYERPEAWLRRVMTNLLIDHHRSVLYERRALRRLNGEVHSVASDDQPRDVWLEMLAPLPPRQRRIVTLYYGEDMSVDEIASVLGIAHGTVKSALGKARARLLDSVAKEVDRARSN